MNLDPRAVAVLVDELTPDTASAISALLAEYDPAAATGWHAVGWLYQRYDEDVADRAIRLLDEVCTGALHGRDGVVIGDAPVDITTTVFTILATLDPRGYLEAACEVVLTAHRERQAALAAAATGRIERSTTCPI